MGELIGGELVRWTNILLFFSPFIVGCEQVTDQIVLKSRVIVEQATSMSNELVSSGSVFEKIWDDKFETNFSNLPTSGQAERIPRSGFWYPEQTGGLNVTDVLAKYDRAYNSGQGSAFEWEMKNRTSRISWAGHCNGYAAAAIRHREPLRDVYRNGVTFSRQDIKALLAGIYMNAGNKFLGGTRCERRRLSVTRPGGALSACEDVNPGLFHAVIANWVGIKKQSIIFDRNGDGQVWNYPLFNYRSLSTEVSVQKAMNIIGGSGTNYTPNSRAKKFMRVSTEIIYADAVNGYEVLDYTQEGRMGYEYVLELDADGVILGGEWSVKSRTQHPDFLWIPLEPKRGSGLKREGNPYIDPQEVIQLWAESRGLSRPSQEPPPYDLYEWDKNWGDFIGYKVKVDGGIGGASFSNLLSKITIEAQSNFSGDDLLEVIVDGQVIAKPKLTYGSSISFYAPAEPGLTKMSLVWKTSTFNNESDPHRIYYYSMD